MKVTLFALSLALAVIPTDTIASSSPIGHGLRASPDHHRRLVRPRMRAHHDMAALHNVTDTKRGESSSSHEGSSSGSDWQLVTSAKGDKFFDQFTFWQGGDPTGGSNHFVSKEEAQQKNLIGVNKDGNAILTIEKGANKGSRASVHLTTKDTFTGGLFIVKAKHIPVGCGMWPATWLLSANPKPAWPSGGEIDIIEGVNYQTQNMLSMHTTPGCWAPEDTVHEILGKFAMQDTSKARNCDAKSTNDEGCGIRSSAKGSYGEPYNQNGGGYHAFVWTEDEAKMYFWTPGEVPKDVASGKPNPSSWGRPEASWGGDSCKPNDFLWNLQLIVSMAICGTWAGSNNVWTGDNIAGQTQSCAKRTGKASCDQYLSGNPDLSEAYWEIESIEIFQQGGRKK